MPDEIQTSWLRSTRSDKFYIACVLLCCVGAVAPMPLLGIPDGFDTLQHLRFVATIQQSIASGDWLPVWSTDNYGFGSVGVRVYPLLSHYLIAISQPVIGDWFDTIWINSLFWMCVGGVGTFRWARIYLNPAFSTFAAIAFVTMPYHLMQLYVYMLQAEFAATAVLPFCFLYVSKVIREGRWKDVLFLAISFALLILTHIPLALIGSICIGVYTLVLIRGNWRDNVIKLISAGLGALIATAYFVFKVVTEMHWVKHSEAQYFSKGAYGYQQYLFPMFFTADEKVWKKMMFLVDAPVLITILFLLVTVIVTIRRNRAEVTAGESQTLKAVSVTGVFLIFIVSLASKPVWESIALLQKVQFPFRFLAVGSLLASFGLALAVSQIRGSSDRVPRVVIYPVLTLFLISGLFTLTQVFVPAETHTRAKFQQMVSEMPNEAGCRCWWPSWANERAFNSRSLVSSPGRPAGIVEWQPTFREVALAQGKESEVRFATFYYPYWQATVNGVPSPTVRREDGTIGVLVPARPSNVRLYFDEPIFLDIAKWVSLFTWILMLTSAVCLAIRSRRNRIELYSV